MMPAFLEDERLAELLVQQATEGLNASETLELRGLLSLHGRPDPEIIERTAAAVLLAGVEPEPLPTRARTRLELAADAFVAGELSSTPDASSIAYPHRSTESRSDRTFGTRGFAWFAAAAGLLLAIVAWWPGFDMPDRGDGIAAVETMGPAQSTELRQRLLTDPEVLRRDWQVTEDPAAVGVSGDVVWDNERQAGFMRFRGLPPNDPASTQYQLWIFDSARGDQYPVDGGVFDVAPGATEVIVPIDAKLFVREPQLFAVTVEKPGGVVVSSRERIIVLANVSPT